MGLYLGLDQIGEFEFNAYDGEDYAHVDMVEIHKDTYRSKGVYAAVLNLAKDFFKTKGLKGIYSEGKSRGPMAEKAWNRIENKKIKEVDVNYAGIGHAKFNDYILEHIKSYQMFEKETKYTVYDNSKGGKFWGDTGAGILPICRSSGKILIPMRSKEVNEPHTWGVFGGKVDGNETPLQAAERELVEETEYKGKYEIIPAYVFEAPTGDFEYHNFIGIVEEEFVPEFNWETDFAKWMTLGELMAAKPKHFGLKKLLEKSKELIEKFAK